MVLTTIKNANLVLAFLLELCVLVALAFWGFSTGSGMLIKIVLGIGAPVLAMIVWGLFGAPKGPWHLNGIWYLLLKIVFFGSAAVALYIARQHVLGVVFALIFVIITALLYVWGQ
jgi:Protein of unknown function (DUF2568)